VYLATKNADVGVFDLGLHSHLVRDPRRTARWRWPALVQALTTVGWKVNPPTATVVEEIDGDK
jgi:hypothetical protein